MQDRGDGGSSRRRPRDAGMAKTRADAAVATVTTRMREPLRAQIERSAKKSGRSMNSEMVARLSRSFIEEDAVGGAELRQIAYTMAAAFGSRGSTYSAAAGRSAEPAEWICDPSSYREAMIAVIEALWAQCPGRPIAGQVPCIQAKEKSEAETERIKRALFGTDQNGDPIVVDRTSANERLEAVKQSAQDAPQNQPQP